MNYGMQVLSIDQCAFCCRSAPAPHIVQTMAHVILKDLKARAISVAVSVIAHPDGQTAVYLSSGLQGKAAPWRRVLQQGWEAQPTQCNQAGTQGPEED